jgi:YHS domain-containing protein
MNTANAVKDRVCGMDVERLPLLDGQSIKGRTNYFCGSKCQEKFDLNPEQYLGKSAGKPQSGHGCCS